MNDEKNTAYNAEMTQDSDYFFDGQRTRLDTRICDYIRKEKVSMTKVAKVEKQNGRGV